MILSSKFWIQILWLFQNMLFYVWWKRLYRSVGFQSSLFFVFVTVNQSDSSNHEQLNNTITDGGSTAPLYCWYLIEEKTGQNTKEIEKM